MRALEPADPRTIGRYRLLARLGVGGMAVVYFGRSPGRRAVAVKVMHADLAAEPGYRERFRREVTSTRAAAGRYCPAVLDADPDARVPWLATEFLPAVPLRDAGALPVEALWPLAAGVAEALASVHRAGVVHLDVKPSNVLLTAEGPRLVDFGIAAGPGTVPDGSPAGSWGFMSPEQAAGGTVSAASDVYSLGATLTFAGTGTGHAAGGLERIADPRLRELIGWCLRPDPVGRPSVADLLERLPPVADGAGWLPATVRADLGRRAGEARHPPVPLPATAPPPASGGVRRRTVLLAAGGLGATAAVAAAVAALRRDRAATDGAATDRTPNDGATDDGTAEGGASDGAATPSATTAPARSLELYAFGRTTVRSLTTVVNGQVETLQGVPLPYRRTVRVPPKPEQLTWRFAYHCAAGMIQFIVSVDGVQVDSYGESSTSEDMRDDRSGTA